MSNPLTAKGGRQAAPVDDDQRIFRLANDPTMTFCEGRK